jgi:dipeptidyl aminopeptidase/acylaminoacyl peptidase
MKSFQQTTRPVRAMARTAVFFLKVFPMLPSKPVDWVTPSPEISKVTYPTRDGEAQGEVYRPSTPGRHPSILVCLGVVPFGEDHPQVPVLGKALARAGFAALLYWSPAMRDFRLDPQDLENIPLAYHWLVEQPFVDPAKSGMIGTCVGGSFALMAAAHPLVQEEVSFVGAYAPFSSMLTFARDIASGTRSAVDGSYATGIEPWKVDQLTRRVFVHSITAWLAPEEAERLRCGFAQEGGTFDGLPLSADGQLVYDLLAARDRDAADQALQRLPESLKERLTLMSPINYLKDIHAPLVQILHDIGDQVIPIGESKRMLSALDGRAGVGYTEMQFSHLDPVKGKLPFFRLIREFGKFFRAMVPLFMQTVE